MKKTLLIALVSICVSSLTLSAADAPAGGAKKGRKNLSPEAKQVEKEMLGKYDTNKDGHLDREERTKITQEDKDKMEKAGLTRGGGRKGGKQGGTKDPSKDPAKDVTK
jgi:hypothetical protein